VAIVGVIVGIMTVVLTRCVDSELVPGLYPHPVFKLPSPATHSTPHSRNPLRQPKRRDFPFRSK
jgi:hypothetical protein